MFALIFGGILLLVGIPFFIIGLVSTKRSQAAQEWPTLPGVILNSTVEEHTSYDSDSTPSTSYEPVVGYQYLVMGQPLTGTRIGYGANRFNYKKALEIASKYPVGSQVMVHYNPDKPADAALETTAQGGKLFTILGIIFVVIGFVLMVNSFFVI